MLDRVVAIDAQLATDITRHALTCKGLTYAPDGAALVHNVDLDFCAVGITAVLGFNGAGKSLLLRLLHGMTEPTSGSVMLNGKPISPSDRKKQAMVFQKPVLLRRSVLDNIRFVMKSRGTGDDAFAYRLLEKVGLAELSSRAARLLSGGEQQRLSLARALACKPELLFLDEATASLDPSSVAVIERILRDESAQGTKIIFISHDVAQAKRIAREIIFVNRGRVSEQAQTDKFFETPVSAAARAYIEGRLPIAD